MESELGGYPAEIESFAQSVFSGGAWHGASLLGTLKTLTVEQALWENAEGYSPWKVALHCAYWKYRATARIAPKGTVPRFPRSPADFPALPVLLGVTTWKADLAFLVQIHDQFIAVVRAQPWQDLSAERRAKVLREILGAAAHDAYHTGMIRNLGVPLL
jgi:hypothetical protein